MTFADRFPPDARIISWQTGDGHNSGTGAQPCRECGALVIAQSDGLDLRQTHSDWHDREAAS